METYVKDGIQYKAQQFKPPFGIPPGVSDVYNMGTWYTGATWLGTGERIGVVSGRWVVTDMEGKNRQVIENEVFIKEFTKAA